MFADLVLAVAQTPWQVFAGAALWGLHMGFTQGLLAKLVADIAPAELRGSAFGISNLVSGVAVGGQRRRGFAVATRRTVGEIFCRHLFRCLDGVGNTRISATAWSGVVWSGEKEAHSLLCDSYAFSLATLACA